MENSEVEIFYLENNLQHLFFVSKACYTFTFAPKLFPLQMENQMCVGAPWSHLCGPGAPQLPKILWHNGRTDCQSTS